MKILSFPNICVILSEISDHEFGIFEKRASDLVLLSRAFRTFYSTEIFQSQITFH